MELIKVHQTLPLAICTFCFHYFVQCAQIFQSIYITFTLNCSKKSETFCFKMVWIDNIAKKTMIYIYFHIVCFLKPLQYKPEIDTLS